MQVRLYSNIVEGVSEFCHQNSMGTVKMFAKFGSNTKLNEVFFCIFWVSIDFLQDGAS